jgi:phospholipid/cholesterol/gamma-HCH transport system substrate-binding protein
MPVTAEPYWYWQTRQQFCLGKKSSEAHVKLLADKDERFKNLFGKAVIFVLLATIGIGATLLWTGIKQGALTTKSPIYFVADSGEGLSEGMPVKYSGFKIGKLNTLALDEQGRVQVEVSIETKYLKLMRQDAVIRLIKEGVIGDGVLALSRGSEAKAALAAGEVVRFERANGLEQAVIEVKNRILPILDDVQQTLHDPQSDVRQTMKNLREFTAELQGTRKLLDKLLGSVDANLNNEVQPLLRSLRQSASKAETISAKLDIELPGLMKKADDSMENIRATTLSVKDAVQKSAPQLPGMIIESRETLGKTSTLVDDTKEVVDSLSTHWPLKNVVPAPETAPVKMDSHD